MTQQIICRKRKCREIGTIESELEEVYNNGNISDQIQLDLFKKMMG